MLNNAPIGPGQQAPAVARAVRAVERLAATGEPCSLSALSRELGIGPSSLLAILTPLRDAGVVVRDAAGRYTLGPALVGLGEAAARACTPSRAFERVAGPLVDRTGETVLLWSACGADLVLAAVREGRHPLRFVPTVGARLAGASERLLSSLDHDGLLEHEIAPDARMVAVPVPSNDGVATAAIAVAGPTARLRDEGGALIRATLRAILDELVPTAGAAGGSSGPVVAAPVVAAWQAGPGATVGSGDERHTAVADPNGSMRPADSTVGPAADWQQAGPIERAELDAFLRQGLVATLSYVGDDGYPATVPLWYAWDGTAFWLAPRPGAEWAAHVRQDPRVSLAVSESTPPLRRVLARGRLVAADDADGGLWRAVAADLAARYAGCGAARPGETTGGSLLRLLPERLIAWRGLLRHPRVAAESEPPGARTPEGHADRRQLG